MIFIIDIFGLINIRPLSINNPNTLLILFKEASKSSINSNVGGVITACRRIYKYHLKLKIPFSTYRYTNIGTKRRLLAPIRIFIDLFFMIFKTFNKKYSYCVTDNSSFIRTIIYLIFFKSIFSKIIFFVDIRGGGSKARLEEIKPNNICLQLIYFLSDKVILQTPSLDKIPKKFKSKVLFLPNTLPSINKNIFIQNSSIRFSQNKKLKIIYSGRINESKGALLILDLLNTELANILEIGFLGPISLSKSSKRKFDYFKNNEFINYHGLAHEENILKILSSYHLFIFPSTHLTEGMPNSILDAISCKLPVLTSNCGFINELFSDKHLTFLNSCDLGSIVDKLNDVILNYKEYILKAENAYIFSSENYDESKYMKNLKNLYKFHKS